MFITDPVIANTQYATVFARALCQLSAVSTLSHLKQPLCRTGGDEFLADSRRIQALEGRQ